MCSRMSLMESVYPISIVYRDLFDKLNLLRPEIWFGCLQKNRLMMFHCPLDNMLDSWESDSSSAQGRVSVEMRTQSNFAIIEMKTVEFVYPYMFVSRLHELVPLV